MILIYSDKITPRLKYIVKFIFEDIICVPYSITSSASDYRQFDGPGVNYSFNNLGGIQILPNGLLFENIIKNTEPGISLSNDIPLLFPDKEEQSFGFDIFAASFFMISRYEEYINDQRDIHGRFLCSFSYASKHGFSHLPVVDIWANMLKSAICKSFPGFLFPEKRFSFIPTIDIDCISAYRGKSPIRLMGSTVKSILRFDGYDLSLRFKTVILRKNDPLYIFDYLKYIHKEYNFEPIYFFQVGKPGKYDGNLPLNSRFMQKTIKSVSSYSKTGIHPSYQSGLKKEFIQTEIDSLQKITGRNITQSRQHYLKVNIPETYNLLNECGIEEDFSLGFADNIGFRAGTCTPFNFYNLKTESEMQLKIYPLQVMDVTLKYYLELTPEDAFSKVTAIINETEKVKGTFISLWHNSYIFDAQNNNQWIQLYPSILSFIANKLK
jgi:hypothetical protein